MDEITCVKSLVFIGQGWGLVERSAQRSLAGFWSSEESVSFHLLFIILCGQENNHGVQAFRPLHYAWSRRWVGRSWESCESWQFAICESLEIFNYFRSLKGKNTNKFDFYSSFSSISAMLNVFCFSYSAYLQLHVWRNTHWWEFNFIVKMKVAVRQNIYMSLCDYPYEELAPLVIQWSMALGEGQAPLSKVAHIK